MDERTAVVTGATRGLGAALVAALAREGGTVVCCGRDADAVEERVASLEAEDATVLGLRADVRDEFDLERLMETASRAGGPGIDLVVAGAAVAHGTDSPALVDASYSGFDDTVRTNVRGVFATVREALPHLNPDGRVLVPTHGNPDGDDGADPAALPAAGRGPGAYAVSKAATRALLGQLAAEVDQPVGGVDPGPLRTDLLGDGGMEPEAVSDLFLWAAEDCPAESLDGRVVTAADREQAD